MTHLLAPSQSIELIRDRAHQHRHLVTCLRIDSLIVPPTNREEFEQRMTRLEAVAVECEVEVRRLECAT